MSIGRPGNQSTSLLDVQIAELVKGTRIPKNGIIPEVGSIKKAILSTPVVDSMKMDAKLCPIPVDQPAYLGSTKFVRPLAIHEVGGHPLRTGCRRPSRVVDLAVEVPKACLTPKEFLDNRYLYRRLLYLSCVARRLRQLNQCKAVDWLVKNDGRRPVLDVRVKGKSVRIHVDTVVEEGAMRPQRFSPALCNLKTKKRPDEEEGEKVEKSSSACAAATPLYNAAVIRDLTALPNQRFLETRLTGWTSVRDAALMLRIWLKQRRLDCAYGGWSGHLVDMLCAHLIGTGQVSKQTVRFQVFRQLLQLFTGCAKWTEHGLSLFDADAQASADKAAQQVGPPALAAFHKAYPVVFVGPTGYDNLAAGVWPSTLDSLAHEADLSLKKTEGTYFRALFMVAHEPLEKFDHLIVLKDISVLKPLIGQFGLESQLLDNGGDVLWSAIPIICGQLRRALDKRLLRLNVDMKSVHLNRTLPTGAGDRSGGDRNSGGHPVLIGLDLSAQHLHERLDRGPQCGTPEGEAFRHFWGAKSHMRHVDGDLRECLLWDGLGSSVTVQIVDEVLNRQLSLSGSCGRDHTRWHQVCTQLLPVLSPPRHLATTTEVEEGGQQHFRTVERVRQDLADRLRRLDLRLDLPIRVVRNASANLTLTVRGVHPVSAAARRTSTFPPLPVDFHSSPHSLLYAPLEHLILSLDLSGDWPNDLDRFRDAAKYFLIKIYEQLDSDQLKCRLHTQNALDVYLNGFIFRIHLALPMECQLLRELRIDLAGGKATTKKKKELVEVDSPEARAWEAFHQHLPHMARVLDGVTHRFGAFSTACRLAKRWLAGHHCPVVETSKLPSSGSGSTEEEGRLGEIALELMVASGFVDHPSYSETKSPIAGFLRFLRLLGNTDFEKSPLIIANIHEQDRLQVDELEALENEFESRRARLPALVLITPFDREGSRWTTRGPKREDLHRLQQLARDTLEVLGQALLSWNLKEDLRAVFRCDLSQFHTIVEVVPGLSTRDHEAIDHQERPGKKSKLASPATPIDWTPELDPVGHLVDELQEKLGRAVTCSTDPHGGRFIGIKWRDGYKAHKKLAL